MDEMFVCAHKKRYLCTRNKERRIKDQLRDNLKVLRKEKIMMTFGIMTVAVVAFAVVAFAGMNLGINACK